MLREQANTDLQELIVLVDRQADDEGLEDGETKLTGAEISERKGAIEEMFEQAKAMEGLDSLEGLMSRPPEEMSASAEEMNAQVEEVVALSGSLSDMAERRSEADSTTCSSDQKASRWMCPSELISRISKI